MTRDPITEVIDLFGHSMPGFWRYALPEEMQWMKLPKERWATCDDCFRAAMGDCREDCRCCTYFPQLPGFAVGLALKDASARPRMLQLVQAGHTLPQGLWATPQRVGAAAQAQADDHFGQRPEMICPFLDSTTLNCHIYPYRNSVCSTFFCENDHGEAGADAWGNVQILVGRVETALGQWAMQQAGLDCEAYLHRLDELAGDLGSWAAAEAWPESARRHLWRDWYGREVEFFELCAEQVMTHRTRLFEIACSQPLLEARLFEEAVRQGIPEPARSEVPATSEGEPAPVEAIWYRIQLDHRNLWHLPFNDGEFVLGSKVEFHRNKGGDRRAQLCGTEPWVVGLGDERIFIGEAEAKVLRLFESPRSFGEALMQAPEVEALDDARAFLAQCLRRDILVQAAAKRSV